MCTFLNKKVFPTLLILVFVFSFVGFSFKAEAASSGPNNPTTGADDSSVGTIAWSNPGNIISSNNIYATTSLDDNQISHYIKATNFNFSIPTNSTINGITVEVEKKAGSANRIQDYRVRIVKNGTIGSTDKSNASFWGASDAYTTYGGVADLWGETWTVADINSANFGIAFSAYKNVTQGAAIIASVDHIRITITYTLTNSAPNAPTLVSPASGTYTSDNTPTLSANYSDPDTGDTGTTNYRIATSSANCLAGTVVASGTSAETATNNQNTTWTPSSTIGSDATYYWCAQNNDGVLTSSWTSMGNFILDTTNPTSNITTPTNNSYSTSTTVDLSGTSSDTNLSSTTISVDSGAFVATGGTASSWTYSAVSLSQGLHTFQTKATDLAGNFGLSSIVNVTVDSIAPETTIDTHPTNPSNSNSASFTFSSEVGATFQCDLDSTGYSSCSSPKSYTSLSEGSHTFSVKATDTAGNPDLTPATYTWSIDSIAPDAATNLGWTTSSPSISTLVTASWTKSTSTDLANQKIQFYSDATCSVLAGGLIDLASAVIETKDFTGLDNTTYTYKITSLDSLENQSVSDCSSPMAIHTINLDHFEIDSISDQAEGNAFNINIIAKDTDNNILTGFNSTVDFTTNSGSISPTISGAFVDGVRTENVTLTGSGSGRTITVTRTGGTETGTSNAFNVSPAAVKFVIIDPTDDVVGNTVSVQIEARDAFDNIVPSYNNTVTLVLSGSATGGGSVSIINGIGTVDISDVVAETVNLSLADTHGLDGTSMQDVIFSPGALHHFIIDSISSPQVAGVDFSTTVTAKDSYNNTATSFGGTVDFSTTTGGTVSPAVSNNFTSGILTQNINVTQAGAGKTFTVTYSGGTESGTSNLFTVNPGATSKFTLNDPGNITVDTRAHYSVTRFDAYDNLVISGVETVYLSSSSVTGKFYDSETGVDEIDSIDISDTNSSVDFWYYDSTIGNWAVTVSDNASPDGDTGIDDYTDSIEVMAAPIVATRFVIIDHAPVIAGETATIVVQAQDDGGNVDTTYNGSVILHASSPSGEVSPGGIVTIMNGEGSVNILDLKAEVASLTLENIPGGTLNVSSTNTIEFLPGIFDHFIMENISSPQTAGSDFTVVITAKDLNENTVTSFAGTVNFTTTAGTVTPLVSNNFSAGILNQDISVTQSGLAKTLTATKTGDIQYFTSNPFDVNPASVANFTVEAAGGGDITTKTINTPFDIRIVAKDAFGNIATGFNDSVDITSTGDISAGGGTTESFTDGVLDPHSVTIANTGSFTITATNSSGPEFGVSNAFNVTLMPIHATRFHIIDPSDAQIGQSVIVTVEAVDDLGNRDDSFEGDINLVTSGSATGGGYIDIINGVGTKTITDNVAEVVTLSLADVVPPTTLIFTSTQNVIFSIVPPTGHGGGGARTISPVVSLTGRAFPGVDVEMMALQNGQVPISGSSSLGSSRGNFDISYSGQLPSSVDTFALVVYDKDKNISQTRLFKLNDKIDNILMAPTVELSQSSVTRGTFMGVTGYAMPNYKIELMIDSTVAPETAIADGAGNYNLVFNTYRLDLGKHTLRVRQVDTRGNTSSYSIEKTFSLVTSFFPKADFNSDEKITLQDLSIFLNQYNLPEAERKINLDINGDGKLDLQDLSLLLGALMH